MPTYQYACTACGEQLEAVQSFTDDALTECPACQGALRKVYSAVGVVFKGSGFYKNDSRSSATSGATSGATSTKSESASKSPATSTGDASSKSDKASKSDGPSTSSSTRTSVPAAKSA